MARGRKRKATVFVPVPWIHNSSSEDELVADPHHLRDVHNPEEPDDRGAVGNFI